MQKADQTAEELIEEEERLKQKTEKKKLKKMVSWDICVCVCVSLVTWCTSAGTGFHILCVCVSSLNSGKKRKSDKRKKKGKELKKIRWWSDLVMPCFVEICTLLQWVASAGRDRLQYLLWRLLWNFTVAVGFVISEFNIRLHCWFV